MTNFYKGGSELPIGQDSPCSPEIKSKKIRVQLPELLASFQLYFTRIFQAPVKHSLSTDIALFTQLLRKKIDNGKMYYKGTCPVLQKRLQSSDQKITKRESSSSSLRALFGWPSDLLRTCVAPSSGVLRLLFGCSSGGFRSAVEADSKPSRSVAEHVSNESRRGPEALPKSTRRGVGASPSSDLCLTNFALSSAFYADGIEFSSGFHRRGPMKSRCGFDENPSKGRSWSGVGRYLNGLFLGTKGTVNSPLSYWECTERVPKRYRECTKELLEIYQRGTKQIRAVSSSLVDLGYKSDTAVAQSAKGEDTELDNGREGSCFKFNGFKTFYERVVSVIDSFVVDGVSRAQRALKYLDCLFDSKNTFRMSLTCLALVFQSSNFSFKALKSIRALMVLALMVSMFSLSAQTPRKDSGADGLSDLTALKPGDKIPDAVWNQSLELNYFNGKKKTIRFSDLKGKLILLDFWSTGCPSCIENIPHMEEIQKRYPQELTILLVNSKRNKETPRRIKLVLDRYKKKYNFEIKLLTLLDDTLLTNLFSHNTIPNITWINQEGIFLGNTLPDEVGIKNIETILQNKHADLQLRGTFRNKDTVMETPPIFDTTGVKFLSAITGYLPDYLPTYPNVAYKDGKSNYQMVNAALNFMLPTAFKNELKGFESTDYVFEDGLKDKIQQMLLGGSRRQYQYSYQLFVADTISPGRAERYFQQSFKDYFHLTIERKRGQVSCYKVEILDNISCLKSKGGMQQVNVNPEEGPIYFQNFPLVTLLSLLHRYVDLPVTFNQPDAMQIDIRMPAGFERMSIAEKLTFLDAKGIRLTMQQQEKEYPYISRIY